MLVPASTHAFFSSIQFDSMESCVHILRDICFIAPLNILTPKLQLDSPLNTTYTVYTNTRMYVTTSC